MAPEQLIEICIDPPIPIVPNASTTESLRQTIKAGLQGEMFRITHRRTLDSSLSYLEFSDSSVTIRGHANEANIHIITGEHTVVIGGLGTLRPAPDTQVQYTLSSEHPFIPLVEDIGGQPKVRRILAYNTQNTAFLFPDKPPTV